MMILSMALVLAAPAGLPADVAAAFAGDAVTGRAVALIDAGNVVSVRGYGLSDRRTNRPVTPQTVFRAGSIGKSVVGISVMMLVEEGKLRLDDRLAVLAPEISFDNPWEASQPIRLAHLLEHTTGWADLSPSEFALDDPQMSLLDGIRAGGRRTSRYPPGRYHAYSGAGHSVAAFVVEKAAGVPFHEFARRRIFEPLGMHSATYRNVPTMATSYLPDGTATPYQHYPLYPSGGLNLSIADLAKFVAFLADGGRPLLRPGSVDRFRHPETTLAARAGLVHGYGLGIMSYAGRTRVLLGHGGSIDSFEAVYRYEPERRRGYAVMVNAGTIPPDAIRALNAYLGDSGDPPQIRGISAAGFARYSGTYQPIAQRNRITPLLDSLTTFVQVELAADRLLVSGQPRVVLPGGLLQQPDRGVPTMVLTTTPDGHELLAATSSLRKVTRRSVVAKLFYGVLFAVALLATLIAAVVELTRRRLSRASVAGVLAFLPVLSLGVVLMVSTSLPSPVSIRLFGTASWLSIAVFVLTLLLPVGAVHAMYASFAPGRGRRAVRGVALLAGVVVATAAAYLAAYGWIGLRTWAMTN